jgi:hypothetical protein
MKFLMNAMVSLTRRLQAINDGEGNHSKYLLEECTNNTPLSEPKSRKKQESST